MMNKTLSGFLIMVMLTMMVHIMVPHHHHDGVFIHHLEKHHCGQNSHNQDDQRPDPCLLQTLDITPPRVSNTENLISSPEYYQVPEIVRTFSLPVVPEHSVRLMAFHPIGTLQKGFTGHLAARAPPC